ncbi:MAG TPA: hypothetical protein VNW92_01880 [Polyangiaceae bacterium]|jgi:hypothetical protein|nr:hypothetical protein [Polyangiaceae bacterium]
MPVAVVRSWSRTRLGTTLLAWAPLPFILLVATAHALPALLNPAELHSDAAVVGLQARHLLHGEWSWFLWGSGYQTATDVLVAGALFGLFSATPLALMLSSFLGHLLLVCFAFGTLRRHFQAWQSALLVSPLILTTGPLHTYMFSPPRQASLTLVFASIWLLDGAPRWRHSSLALAAGAFVAGLSCFADPYALLFLPGLGLFVLLGAAETPRPRVARDLAAVAAGSVAGFIPVWLLTHSAQAAGGVFQLHSDVLTHNLDLLEHVCFPYLMGTTAYYSARMPLVEAWPAPLWFRAIQWAGAGLLLSGIAFGALALLRRSIPLPVRRLAALGAVMLPVTLGAFALSVMVMDRLSARYLVAIVLMAPFALGPALISLGLRRFALLLAPFLVSAAVAGWLSHGDDVAGIHIVVHSERANDETLLADQLRKHDLRYGLADYWVAYRLTFLFEERTIIAPWHEQLDRYAPYRSAVASQTRIAYIFDPWRSKEQLASREADIEAGKTDFSPKFETFRAGRYTVLLLQRAHAPGQRLAADHVAVDSG